MTKSSNDKYTDPELRDRIKEEIQAGDKGGEPGQWSARKAQMMAKQYKEEGGGYKDNKKDEKAQHLDQWTKEEWQTKDGDANARSEEGTHRYLPKKAWEKLDEEEKEATDEQKLEGSKAGDQFVPNTDKAKKARKEVSEEPEEERSANQKDSGNKKRKTNAGPVSQNKDNKDQDEQDDEEEEADDDEEDDDADIAVPQNDEEGEEEEEPEVADDDAEDEDFQEDEEEDLPEGDEEFDPEAEDV